jgi:trigger factor
VRNDKLKIETQILEDHQVKLTVEIDDEILEQAKRKTAKKIARQIKIPGFRPGKAPYHVIQRQVGDEALLEESLETLINDNYPQIIEKAEITPYGPGKFENISSFEPLTLEFIVPLMADVELGDYKEIHFPYEVPQVNDEEVAAVVEDLRHRQAVEESVERPAEAGDHVYLSLSAKKFEDAEENGSEVLIEERSSSIIIAEEGVDSSAEWPFDGFSRELIGMSNGENKNLIYTYSDESEFESLQGVTAEFSVKIEDVKSRTLPELDDEFAQSIGEYEDLESLEGEIRTSLVQRTEETYNSEYDDQVMDVIVDESTIQYPPQMLEHEIDEVIFQLERRLGSQGLDLETYLKTQDMDEQGLREEATPAAESRLKRSLVLLEIAKQEEIDVSEGDLQQETERTLDSITQYMSETDRKKFSSQETVSNLAGNLYAEMRMNRTLEYLRTAAKGELGTEDAEEDADETELSQSEMAEEESSEDEASTEEPSPKNTDREKQEELIESEPEKDEAESEQEVSQEGE